MTPGGLSQGEWDTDKGGVTGKNLNCEGVKLCVRSFLAPPWSLSAGPNYCKRVRVYCRPQVNIPLTNPEECTVNSYSPHQISNKTSDKCHLNQQVDTEERKAENPTVPVFATIKTVSATPTNGPKPGPGEAPAAGRMLRTKFSSVTADGCIFKTATGLGNDDNGGDELAKTQSCASPRTPIKTHIRVYVYAYMYRGVDQGRRWI